MAAPSIRGDDGKMEDQRMLRGIVGNRRGRIGVKLDDHPAGVIGEEVGERRLVHRPRDLETKVSDKPARLGGGIGNVECEVFEFHRSGSNIISSPILAGPLVFECGFVDVELDPAECGDFESGGSYSGLQTRFRNGISPSSSTA